MKSWDPLGALGVVAIAGTLGGCSCASERASEAVTTPVGRWNRAFATVEYHPSFHKGGREHPASVIHSLSVEEAPPNRAYVILSMQYEGKASAELFREMRDTKYVLMFAPDGSALAASTDGGKAWTLFDLASLASPTEEPFWCRHRSVGALDPWPSMRALALSVLASVDVASPTAAVHRGPDTVEWPGAIRGRGGITTWNAELLGASRYACFHREDPEIRAALVTAFLHPDYPTSDVGVDECLGQMIKSDPAVRRRIDEAAKTAGAPARARIQHVFRLADPPPLPKKDSPPPPKSSP